MQLSRPYVSAIITAAGRGRRLGAQVPKQLLRLAGRSVLQRTVDVFDATDCIDEIVVAVPPELLQPSAAGMVSSRKPLRLVPGGDRRQDSVANGFDVISERSDLVVVHDAARPFLSSDLIVRTLEAARQAGAAVAALAARDTVKEVRIADGQRLVRQTLPRETIYLVQTPQAFRRDVLRDAVALGRAGLEATDEAGLAEKAGHPVRVVEGDPRNIKITTPEDLAYGRAVAGEPLQQLAARVGTGYDLHRLVEGRPLILAGVTIPFDRGLTGHSDADVVAHAVTDALLGAVGAGDIGGHFPDSDSRWKGASSLQFLRHAAAVVRDAGYALGNLDVVVIAERPRLTAHIDAMKNSLARILMVDSSRISIKGKTNEGVGEIGRGEAIAVHAVALLRGLVEN